jgi:hypothetical protein
MEPTRRSRERFPLVAREPLEQQHLAARALDRDPRGNDARVVHDRERVEELRQLTEDVVADLSGRSPVDEQPRLVPPLRGLLRDQLLWQLVVKLPGVHPTGTLASLPMDEIREAIREGLREDAAPIARRLAEVKGLSWNAVRRLDNIERAIEGERDARIDDLALLVELLTEGWRSLSLRLDRIEAALVPPETNVVRLRDSA